MSQTYRKADVPYSVRFGPYSGSSEWIGFIIRAFALLLRLEAELPYRLVYGHVVWQQMFTDIELQAVTDAARVQELSRLQQDQRSTAFKTVSQYD